MTEANYRVGGVVAHYRSFFLLDGESLYLSNNKERQHSLG